MHIIFHLRVLGVRIWSYGACTGLIPFTASAFHSKGFTYTWHEMYLYGLYDSFSRLFLFRPLLIVFYDALAVLFFVTLFFFVRAKLENLRRTKIDKLSSCLLRFAPWHCLVAPTTVVAPSLRLDIDFSRSMIGGPFAD